MSQFAALCDSSETTSTSHKQNKTRVKSRNSLMFKGREVCLPVFLFANDIGIKRYRLLKQQYGTSGIEPHTHGNAGKPAKHWLRYFMQTVNRFCYSSSIIKNSLDSYFRAAFLDSRPQISFCCHQVSLNGNCTEIMSQLAMQRIFEQWDMTRFDASGRKHFQIQLSRNGLHILKT